jgi:DNA-binding MarR family transcriptional regulator
MSEDSRVADQAQLDAFRKATESLKLYRRADLDDERGNSLIDELYVDPLPNDHVLNTLLSMNTTFLVGRKGTGKSTVFLRAQRGFLARKNVMSTYIDIKTVYESANNGASGIEGLLERHPELGSEHARRLLLGRAFIHAVIQGLRNDIEEQLKASWRAKLNALFGGTIAEFLNALDDFIEDIDNADFQDIGILREQELVRTEGQESGAAVAASAALNLAVDPGVKLGATADVYDAQSSVVTANYSKILLRSIDIKQLIGRLREMLTPLGVKHLVVFVDDFSELPLEAMQPVVDSLLAPLNNWSEEFIKFKIAAYPGRIYYGAIDKSKVDEVSLDIHSLYGQANVTEMEEKAIDFTKRLVLRRMTHFAVNWEELAGAKTGEQIWRTLFYASMGNPRTLGYILFFVYENQLLYEKTISTTSIQNASRRYYEDKIEPYFAMGRFLHESFGERSAIYGLKELLESVVNRARGLRRYEGSSLFKSIDGRPPTSHFHVNQVFDSLLSTLELNFFLTRYYDMADRDGRLVTVYALNYGLCQKHSIVFGRPSGHREYRLYFVERVFDYTPLMQSYIASNQEIKCDTCGTIHASSLLESLRLFKMKCPNCDDGHCSLVNISRKYESLLREVDEASLLPHTELAIMQTLSTQERPIPAGEIAGELDVSPQLVGWRSKKLAERDLVDRSYQKTRRVFKLTETGRRIYLSDPEFGRLNLVATDDDIATE